MASRRIQLIFPVQAVEVRSAFLIAFAVATLDDGMLMMYSCHSVSCSSLTWVQVLPLTLVLFSLQANSSITFDAQFRFLARTLSHWMSYTLSTGVSTETKGSPPVAVKV